MKNYRLLALTAIVVLGIFGIIGTALAGSPFCDPKLLADPIKTDAGYVSGTMIGTLDQAVRIYRGIPYAAPPVGDLRWKAPQPVAHWSGIRETTQFTKMAIQPNNLLAQMFPTLGESEDCLYLNVVTPARSSNDKLPVMVWFHGGGFTIGTSSSPLFTSYRLPSNGVITVSVNHRLGVFGLFAHPLLTAESGTSGNYMVQDMIASLKWVKKNIRAFGGDPKNVTIFGQSGGGGKVSALIASPMAAGLFNKAIIQSGAPFPGSGQPLATLEANGQALFTGLGVSTLADARALDYATIVAKDNELQAAHTYGGWALSIDNQVLNGSPLDVIVAGQGNKVHLIAGSNAGELTQFSFMIPAYVQMFNGIRSQGMKTYAYIFDQVPANWRALGGVSVHGMELSYLFGDYDNTIEPITWWLDSLQEMAYNPAIFNTIPGLTDVDKEVSENMMALWANFAKSGYPCIRNTISWPVWSPSTDRYLFITDPLQVKSGFSTVGP